MAAGLNRMAGRFGRGSIPLGLAGLAGLIAAPPLVGALFERGPRDGRDPAAFTAFAVINPAGARIGSLDVEYPRAMRENEDAPVLVRYGATDAWRTRFAAAASQLRLEVALHAARLDLAPPPPSYAFDLGRVAATGSDGRRWIVSPRAEGDYILLLRLAARPAGFSVRRVAANGEALGPDGGDLALPVSVTTRYRVAQWAVDLAKAAVALVSFLLTLPAAALIARRWFGRAEPEAAPVPPAPAPAPTKRRRPRGR